MSTPNLGFIHQFVASASGDKSTLLLLHGTGGDENDLLGIGQSLLPGANLLSPRGKVLEGGMPRFFRRLAEGVFDVEDLRERTHELAKFVADACEHYKLDAERVIAVGFSNGANIAAAMMLLSPQALRGGVLMRAMVPLEPPETPDLKGRSALILSGEMDPIVPRDQPERLAAMLREGGADVEVKWQRAGHGLTQQDLQDAHEWLQHLSLSPYSGRESGRGSG
jgi:predicted esterase